MEKNRLIEAVESTLVDNAKKLQFTYDYMGRRIQKQVYAWDAASDLRYVYDGWNLIQSLDAQDSNAVVKDFTWGLDLSGSLQGAGGVGGLLSVTVHEATGDSAYYPSYDANGNISEYLDNTGSVVAHYEYSPFGRLTLVDSETGAPDFNHRFSTKYLDDETKLYYYGMRYYSSELGRWLSRDPIGERGGVNVYGFVGNNGVHRYDPQGLYPGSPDHGDTISPSDSSTLISKLQKAVDQARASELAKLGKRKITYNHYNRLLLAKNTVRLMTIRENGNIGHEENNRFVFTCKYGWIDHGHFYNNAIITYAFDNAAIAEWLSDRNEDVQSRKGSDSAFTPEDLISNALCRKFGKRMRNHDKPIWDTKLRRFSKANIDEDKFFDVAAQWDAVLRSAGAVKWSNNVKIKGKSVEKWLQADIDRFQANPVESHSIQEGLKYQSSSPARCLCDGNKPIKELEY